MARQITVSFAADASKLTRTLGDVERQTKSFGDKLTSVGGKLTAGLTLPLVAGLGMATKAAAEDEAAQQKLAKTLENTVGATDKTVAAVEKHLEAMMKVSTFSDDELRPAFASLVTETRNVEEAQKLMTTAMDLAAAKGIPLEEAANLLIKAHNGQTKGLQSLGIETKNAEGKAVSFTEVMRDVNAVVGGQAQEALGTTAGKTAALKRDLGEMAEEVGTKVLPHLNKLVGWASGALDWFTKLPEPVQNVGLALAGIAVLAGPILTMAGNLQKLAAGIASVNAAGSTGLVAQLAKVAPPLLAAALGWKVGGELGEAIAGAMGRLPQSEIDRRIAAQQPDGGVMLGPPAPRAGGGPVMAGRSYLVGERGPELFTPGMSGGITPNGAGGTTVVKLYLDGREIQQSLLRLQRTSGNLGIVGA